MSKSDLALLDQQYATLRDLAHAQSMLSWDQEVMMPPGGAEARARSLAALAGALHEKQTAKEHVRLVKQLKKASPDLPARGRRAVEIAAEEVRKATCLPADMATELALAKSKALEGWKAARANNDFKAFAKHLERLLELSREVARLQAPKRDAYDALLDEYEPGASTAELGPLLDQLEEVTVPLVKRMAKVRPRPASKPLTGTSKGTFPLHGQVRFVRQVVEAMGVDFDRARLDTSTHPFCGGDGPGDVRLTGRWNERDLRQGLYGAIHEAGHGLYEQGRSPKLARTPLGGAVSMAIHESQSRLWENMIGRSKPFWRHFLPRAKKLFPEALGKANLESVWRAANQMTPSMIRVEADELTYNLHIILRTGIERELLDGSLKVKDLPKRWNARMQETLGLTPKTDTEGCLQDIHWSMGAIGYFPTYSIGNLYAAQFMEAARADLPDLDAQVAKGQLLPLREWLQNKIHRHDRLYTAGQVVKRVTGRPLSVDPFATYIEGKVAALS